jgi:rSAM/selenodomain-associated transferase 1
MNSQVLVVFVKHPRLGQVKIRLAAEIGKRRALEVYRKLVMKTLVAVGPLRRAGIEIRIFGSPSNRLIQLRRWLGPQYGYFPQRGRDLGERLRRASTEAFHTGATRVVMIGSDCPGLTPALLRQAFRALDRRQVVLGPAQDGGYYLIGLARPCPGLFETIPWSTEGVWEATLRRIQDHRFSWQALKRLRDVDHAADLKGL